jgi:hypothetical protein
MIHRDVQLKHVVYEMPEMNLLNSERKLLVLAKTMLLLMNDLKQNIHLTSLY